MIRYVVVRGVGSDEIEYNGKNKGDAIEALGKKDREMYDIEWNDANTHILSIERSMIIGGQHRALGGLSIHRNVLDALLERSSEAQTGVPSSE